MILILPGPASRSFENDNTNDIINSLISLDITSCPCHSRNMNITWNTKEKGSFYFLLYKEKNDYVAVCLNLNLIEYGKNPKELWISIKEAAFAHLGAVRKKNLPDELLNSFAPQKFWKKLDDLRLKKPKKFTTPLLKKPSLLEVDLSNSVFYQAMQPYQGKNFFDFCH